MLACIVALASCSVEKRVHRNGYHVEWFGSKQKIQKASSDLELAIADEEVAADEAVADVVSVEPILENQTVEPTVPVATEEIAVAEEKEVVKQAKKEISNRDLRRAAKEMNATMKANYDNVGLISTDDSSTGEPSRGLLILLCFLIPPLAMYLYEDDFTNRVLVNLILTILCGIPGIIHALIIIGGEK